ncbi:sigma-70 family RNA polymerase sigma factor [Paludibaculum fermentans]|uniref:sigma-70 family RNA polymerase sigma factor n=1 Tax=Paludibaculum fermentans TaxID=1473598 RepID=UPI003EB7B6A8
MEHLTSVVARAKTRDLDAWSLLVHATQAMAYAVALRVLQDPDQAQDAAQEAYLRAFRNLAELEEPAAFISWLRRIVITVAETLRKASRTTLLRLDDISVVPVLDEAETRWSEAQRRLLSGALLTLTASERRLCDRRYHGRWSTARLAGDAGIDEAVMRKRLQRIRDKLRKEMEMAEQRDVGPEDPGADLSAEIVELLARPKLTDLPDNPVGRILESIRGFYSNFAEVELPEILDLTEIAKAMGCDLPYLTLPDLYRIDDHRALRSDLTLPLLMRVHFEGQPLRVWAAGKAYRNDQPDATHLEAFHQAEILWLEEHESSDQWSVAGRVLQSIEALLPGKAVKIVPLNYSLCSYAREIEVEHDGKWTEVAAWGVYTDRIVRYLGGDPARHTAVGVAYGLERLAMLRFEIDDIRTIDVISLA